MITILTAAGGVTTFITTNKVYSLSVSKEMVILAHGRRASLIDSPHIPGRGLVVAYGGNTTHHRGRSRADEA